MSYIKNKETGEVTEVSESELQATLASNSSLKEVDETDAARPVLDTEPDTKPKRKKK